jgi:hypothetical protein
MCGQLVPRSVPRGITGVESGAEVSGGEVLNDPESLGALVRRLGGIVSGDPAKPVLRVEQGEQRLGSW